MKYEIEKEKVDYFFEAVRELETLLTERISDLHNVEGAMQARHAYIFYRRVLWDAKYSLRDSLKEIKEKSK
jgi:hypothetical protein